MTMPSRITGGVDTHLDVHVAAALDRARRSARCRVVRHDTGGLLETARVARASSARSSSSGSKAPAPTAPASPGSSTPTMCRWSRSIDRTVNGVAAAARAIPKTRSPQPAPRSRVTRAARPRPATATWKPCGCCVSHASRRAKREPRRSTRCVRSSPPPPTTSAPSCATSTSTGSSNAPAATGPAHDATCTRAPSSHCGPWPDGRIALEAEIVEIDAMLDRARRANRPRARRHHRGRHRRPQPRCSSQQATTLNDSAAKPPSLTSAACHPSTPAAASKNDTASTAAVTAKPTQRSGTS